jgi:hypothetical protein
MSETYDPKDTWISDDFKRVVKQVPCGFACYAMQERVKGELYVGRHLFVTEYSSAEEFLRGEKISGKYYVIYPEG